LALYLLGSPRVENDGAPVVVTRRKALALLAYLAVTGQSQSRDTLATLLWPEQSQSRARGSLRSTLSILKKDLGAAWLDAEREAVQLGPEVEVWLDVAQFRERLAACRTHGHSAGEVCPGCLTALSEAAALYRDDFMAGFSLRDSPAFDEWQFFQGEGLRRELASALERLVQGHSAAGAYEDALPAARRWVALDPLHEPAQRALMQVYAWSGQRAAALRQYAECERLIEEELNAPPEAETVELCQAIQERRVRPPAIARRGPERAGPEPTAAMPESRPAHNLPVQLSPFVGRQVLLADLAARLQSPACRLLTLVGPGGSGKTRLALEAAAAQLDSYAHGVYLVALAPLETPVAIVPTVAAALGLSLRAVVPGGARGPSSQQDAELQQLLGYLSQRNVLLFLDNVEHLLPPAWTGEPVAADLIVDLLRAAPRVKVLVTSRVQLDIQGEHLFPIPGLDVPREEGAPDAAHYSAVQLFLQHAQRVSPTFCLTVDNQAAVIEICRLVEGMPLGILLAAAWLGVLTPAEIAVEIRRSLDFLEADLRDLPARQRSMRAVFDHTWRLLTADERAVMEALSVFRGGFTRQAAQRVTGATLHDLRSLAAKSLLQRSTGSRYEIHELARQYAAEKLAQSPATHDAVHDRYSAHYVALLEQWAADLGGDRQRAALAEIELETENARAAWNWAVERLRGADRREANERGPVEWLDRAMEGLCRSLQLCGHYRGGQAGCRDAAASLAALPTEQAQRVRAKALAWQGTFGCLLGRTEDARQLLQCSLDLLDSLGSQDTRAERAFVLLQQGVLAEPTDRERARQLLEQSLALYRALNDRSGSARALRLLGFVQRLLGDYDGAWQLCQESLSIRRALGDRDGVAECLSELGWAATLQARYEEGEQLIRESLALYQEIGGRARVADGLLGLGVSLLWLGRFVEAHAGLEESVALLDELGERKPLALANNLLGLTKAHLGQYEDARRQSEVALELYRDSDNPADLGHILLVLGHVALAQKAYVEAHQWLQQGVTIYREVGVLDERVWALADLAIAAYRLGDPGEARQHLSDSLRLSLGLSNSVMLWYTLPAAALLWAEKGEVERAVELYALTLERFPTAKSRWFEDVYGQAIAAAAATLPPEVVARAQERGRALDLEATVRELAAELVS